MKLFWKFSLLILGGVFLTLGIVGIFFPVLPTTPFLLLSATCFLKSSKAAYRKLMSNRILGKYIFQYRITKAVPLKSKITALLLLWLGILISLYHIPLLLIKILLLLIAIGVTLHISSLKTMTKEDKERFMREYQYYLEHNSFL